MGSDQKIVTAKQLVQDFNHACEKASDFELLEVIEAFTSDDYHWRGSRPFYQQDNAYDSYTKFWLPMRKSFAPIRRRESIFFAGWNDVDDGQSLWTCSMGHFTGLFDKDWIGIQPNRKMVQIRYAEFHEVVGEKIKQTALFLDIADLMQQAGMNPFPNQQGAVHIHPAPRSDDGISLDSKEPKEAEKTMTVLNKMIDDLDVLNKSGNDNCSPEYLARSWHEDMAWYGPAGIGSTYTIERYQEQHQYPFREGLKNKKYNGHIARIAEGNYAAFFGWPNLTNSPKEGFLGLAESDIEAEMRVVDVYRRDGDKLSENWVIIDLPHYFSMLGVDFLPKA